MRSSIFQSPLKKVFRRTQDALTRLGMRIITVDEADGSISAESGFSWGKQSMKIDLFFEKVENQITKVTIRGLLHKKHFFQKPQNAEMSEIVMLDEISSSL